MSTNFSSNGLTITKSGASGNETTLSTSTKAAGKWYFRMTVVAGGAGVGIANGSANLANFVGGDTNSIGLFAAGVSAGQFWYNNADASATAPPFAIGDTLGIAVNFDTKTIWVENVTKAPGVWNNGAAANNPTNLVGGFSFAGDAGINTGPWYIAATVSASGDSVTLNTNVAGPAGYGAWDDGTVRAALFFKLADVTESPPLLSWPNAASTASGAAFFSAAYASPNQKTPIDNITTGLNAVITNNACVAPSGVIRDYGDWLINIYYMLGNRAGYLGDPRDNLRIDSHGVNERAGGIIVTDNAPSQYDPVRSNPVFIISNSGRTVQAGRLVGGQNSVGAVAPAASPGRSSGLWYFELTIDFNASGFAGGGAVNSAWVYNAAAGLAGVNSFGYTPNGVLTINGVAVATLQTFTTTNTLCFALNLNLGTLYTKVAGGLWNNSPAADPVAGLGGYNISACYSLATPLVPAAAAAATNDQITGRFVGADQFFAPPTGYAPWADGVAAVGLTGTRTASFSGAGSVGQFGVSLIIVPAVPQTPLPAVPPSILTPSASFTIVIDAPGDGTIVFPPGVTNIDSIETWGAGGAGGDSGGDQAGGGGSGGYSAIENVPVASGTSYSYHVGRGGTPNYAAPVNPTGVPAPSGEDTWFNTQTFLLAKGGSGGQNDSQGTGVTAGGVGGQATAGAGTVKFSGAFGGKGKASK